MKKIMTIINTSVSKFPKMSVLASALTVAAVSLGITTQVYAYTLITSSLDLGESNVDVTSLQTFLAANPTIYPRGLVTGYFGALTADAVQKFQATYGLDQVGRVGPLTRDKINSIINAGGWTSNTPVTSTGLSPYIYSVGRNVTQNSFTVSWNTNELASGKVFYSISPVSMNEGDINSVGFGATSGFTATNDNLARLTQQVSLVNLQPNTTYYYVVVATDLDGNVSVWNPNTTFRTNQ